MAESKQDLLHVVVVESKKAPYKKAFQAGLKPMQEIVGGTIQALYPFSEPIALICNDEGKVLGLPFNRGLRDKTGKLYDVISGTFFLCGAPANSDCFASLTEQQSAWCLERFRIPELIFPLNGSLIVLPMVP